MALRCFLKELNLAWNFNYRDLAATVVPFSLFTLASSLEAHNPVSLITINAVKSIILSFMLLYSFTISNQINGIEEDRLNKPDRPIVSGQVNLNGAYARYFILIAGILIVSYAMKVQIGAVLFVVFGAMHNFTRLSSFGPTKDFFTTAVLTSGLYCAWKLGSGNEQTGAEWISCLAVNLFFSVSIQDLRDITGDAATNRWTTPLLLGEPYGRMYIIAGTVLARTSTLSTQYLQSKHIHTSIVCTVLIIIIDIFLLLRVFRLRDIVEDKKTHRFYMMRFSLELLFAMFILRA